MKKSKIITIVLLILLLLVSGCKNNDRRDSRDSDYDEEEVFSEDDLDSEDLEEDSDKDLEQDKEQEDDEREESASKDLSDLSMEAYENFLADEGTMSFERFMTKGYMGEDLFRSDKEYTFSEVLDVITEFYFQYSDDKRLESIDYGYIDCGNDGVKELVICFNGIDVYAANDSSTLVYVIKYIEGELALCYSYETWPRSYTEINEYGYYESAGSSGATNHSFESGIIDKDGNVKSIVYIESEFELYGLGWHEELSKLSEAAEGKEINDYFEVLRISFDRNGNDSFLGSNNGKEVYSFYIYDENFDEIEDDTLYTQSVYKDIFDEAGVSFVTPDEFENMILEKEEELGVTSKIKNGKEIEWEKVDSSLFSNYVK